MSSIALALLIALPLAAPAPPAEPSTLAAQDPAPEGDDPPAESAPDILLVTDRDRLLALYYGRHGGRDAVAGMRRLSMTLEFVEFDAETGEERALEGFPPLYIELDYGTRARRMRMESTTQVGDEEQTVLRLTNCLDQSDLWIGGEPSDQPDARLETIFIAKQLTTLLDLLYRPDAAGMLMRVEGVRRRQGVEYLAAHIEFAPARAVFAAFRTFYDQQSSLVARVDTFDAKTYRYVSTMLVEDYVTLGELRFPGRFVFLGPDGEPQRAWIMRDVALNPEVPDERFEAP